jgi:hypothetical protein
VCVLVPSIPFLCSSFHLSVCTFSHFAPFSTDAALLIS